MSVYLIVGTRPQIIKSVPIINESVKQGLDLKIIHTGQHYDFALSDVFLRNLIQPNRLLILVLDLGLKFTKLAK